MTAFSILGASGFAYHCGIGVFGHRDSRYLPVSVERGPDGSVSVDRRNGGWADAEL